MKKIIIALITICALGVVFYEGYTIAQKQIKNKQTIYSDNTAQFIHKNPSDTLTSMTQKKPGIYYYGFPTCPWCLELLPVFDNVLRQQGKKAYVVNTHSEIYTSADNILLENFFVNHTNQKRLTVPFIVIIKNDKKVTTHIGTVSGHNASESRMNNQQNKNLTEKLDKLVRAAPKENDNK